MSDAQAGRQPQFTEVARAYDALMSTVPYRKWVEYVEKLLKRARAHPRTVLDIACGTGNVTFALADRGYRVAGLDLSEPMLAVARDKAARQHRDIPFTQADMTAFSLPERYDLAVCLYDSINYLLSLDDVRKAFQCAQAALNPGGHYIFDVNTIFALRENLFTQRQLDADAEVRYDWVSRYNEATRVCEVTMEFWVKQGRTTRHFTEVHRERGYALNDLMELLSAAGFHVLACFEAYTFRSPRPDTDRAFFVARKQ